ncbi:MAG: sel1 repeat family protein [Alphaproteobacteria bacterium]|nr:sel1 repeat family protein [Alphaproteobacteria bacterium]
MAAYDRGDYAEAVKWYRKAAEQGDTAAMHNLGFMYTWGQGVPQDYAEAAKWFRRAADLGAAEAQGSLGLMYAEGKGVPQDYAEAAKWFRKAAEQGVAYAQNSLGIMYADGQVVPQDDVQALMWFSLAAATGDDGAIKNRELVLKRMTPEQIAEANAIRHTSSRTTSVGVDQSGSIVRPASICPSPRSCARNTVSIRNITRRLMTLSGW